MINLIQPLPFYDRLTEQDYYKESCNGVYKFLSSNTNLIPFQIIVPSDYNTIDSFKIVGFSNEFEVNLSNLTNQGLIKFITAGSKKWVAFFGGQLKFIDIDDNISDLVLCSDYYHFEVTVNGVTKYSELFFVGINNICSTPITMEIQAWHSSNFQNYTFDQGFKFKAFFNAFITNVTPEITDEYSKDGYERKVLQRRVIEYQYNIEIDPIPNSISIGLAFLTSLKNILIKHNGNEYVVKDITYKQDPFDGGCLDSVKLTFTIFDQDTVRTNC